MAELPLVLFTVLSQIAAGALVTLWLIDTYLFRISKETGKFITMTILGIGIVSILASLLHLGHPFKAFLALTHLANSWLSREVALVVLFIAALAAYLFQWEDNKEGSRKTIGAIASVLAILTVISSGMVYVLPAVPAWNNMMPVISFILTALLLGPLFVAAVFAYKKEKFLPSAYSFSAGVIVLGTVVFSIYISLLLAGQDTAYLTGVNIINSSFFWLRVALGWIIPLVLLAFIIIRKGSDAKTLVFYAFASALIGEIIGRELFYSTVVFIQVAGF